MSKKFELMAYTASRQGYADQIINFLDPTASIFAFRFYRDDCTLIDGIAVLN